MNKIIQVVPSIGKESSGPSYSVPALCRGLVKNGCNLELHTLSPKPDKDFGFPIIAHRRHVFPLKVIGRSPEMLHELIAACQSADIIHNHSFWMMPNIYPALARRESKCRLVNQPRGTLSKWALENSKWRKRFFGWFGQYAAMRATDMWVATSKDEYEDIRRLNFMQPVVILPNGVDLPPAELSAMKNNARSRRRMLFLSRIHPKKNVDTLIRCWAKLEKHFPDWDLSIVGPDKNNQYADEMKSLARSLKCERVTFEGELNGREKYRFMAGSECGVLPTHSENFGMAVAESLACGIPVICSHGAPWAGLITEKCGWWVPTEKIAIETAMKDAMSTPREELMAMGARGREWMQRDFSWEIIGCKMKIAYKWLLSAADKPEWVVED